MCIKAKTCWSVVRVNHYRLTRHAFVIVLVLLAGCPLFAQMDPEEAAELSKKYKTFKNDTSKIAACLKLSHYYLFKGHRLDGDLDSAFEVLTIAQQLSDKRSDKARSMAVASLFGNYYVIKGQWTKGSSISKKAIDYYHSKNNFLEEANSWSQLGQSIEDINTYGEQKLKCFENARQLFDKIGLPLKAAETMQYIALCNASQNKFDSAEHIMLRVIAIYKPLDNGKMLDAYNTLAGICEYRSDQHKHLKYSLELVQLMEASGDTSMAPFYYAQLARTYAHVHLYNESLIHILKALDILKRRKEYDDFYGDLSLAIFDYIQLGKSETALTYLLKITKEVPPQDLAHTVDLNDMLGKCYEANKAYAKAEEHYLTMMKLFSTTQNTDMYSTREQKTIDFIHYHQTIGNFYVATGQYQKAGYYYGEILKLPPGSIRPITLRKVHLMQFKVDSASGNFISAIGHYQTYKELEDSLFHIAKNRQLQELNIKYETEKKDKDIQLLTQQGDLQQAQLIQSTLTRNITIVGALGLLFLAGLLYYLYNSKQKNNKQLTNLLNEKDWLLKEIHHRVKNNLQTVLSLLESQSRNLSSEASHALMESQNRVYAMSLIHKKLYQSGDVSSINMEDYLRELVQHLRDGLSSSNKIRYTLHVDPIELDVSQAVPIGLIVNEALTNAIKYAFTEANENNEINISLTTVDDGKITLHIADNGVGIPQVNKNSPEGLGLKLMRGLTEDIDGTFSIETVNGVTIAIGFVATIPFQKMTKILHPRQLNIHEREVTYR